MDHRVLHRLRPLVGFGPGAPRKGAGAINYNEAAVFKWVLIFVVAVGSAIGLALLAGGLVGALWGLVLAIAGITYGVRWSREWWRNSRDLPGGPDHRP